MLLHTFMYSQHRCTTCSWIALNQISRSEKLLLVLVGLLPGYRMDTYTRPQQSSRSKREQGGQALPDCRSDGQQRERAGRAQWWRSKCAQ